MGEWMVGCMIEWVSGCWDVCLNGLVDGGVYD